MKTIYTFLTAALLLVVAPYASAQTKTVKYLSKSGINEVAAAEAFYFAVEEVNPDGIITSTHYLMEDSVKVQLRTYTKLEGEPRTLHGPQQEWHRNGTLAAEYTYENGKPVGEHKYWYETGELDYIRKYSGSSDLSSLEAYHKNGKLRRAEIYERAKLYKGKVFDETGNEIEYFPMLQMPEFPGGELKFQHYLAKSIRYPGSAVKKDITGLVVVSFVVDVDGAIRDLEVIKNVHKDLDAEAVRVLSSMPKWKPGLLEGKATSIRFTVPVRFSMN